MHPTLSTTRSVCAENIDVVSKRWVDLGRPRKPDWSVLLEGMDDGIDS